MSQTVLTEKDAVELKNAVNESTTNHHACNQLQTCKREILSLFCTNAVLVISDGIEAGAADPLETYARVVGFKTFRDRPDKVLNCRSGAQDSKPLFNPVWTHDKGWRSGQSCSVYWHKSQYS